jgi:hypothetical protein
LSEYFGLGLGGKIKQYLHGLMLLALAGVIIAMLENIIATIPDQQINIGGDSGVERAESKSNIIVIPKEETTLRGGDVIAITPHWSGRVTSTLYSAEYLVFLRDPPLGHKYVIVFRFVSEIRWVNIINFDYNQYWRQRLQVYDGYVHIEWADTIAIIEIYTDNRAYTETLYIFVVRTDTDVPLTLDFSRATQRPRFSDVRESFENNTVVVLTIDVMWYPYGDYQTYTFYPFPRLANPPPNHRYVIVFKFTDSVERVYIHNCNNYVLYDYWELYDYVHGDYVFLPWNSCILDIFITAYPFTYSYSVYIVVLSENTRVPFPFSESEILSAILRQQQEQDTSKDTSCPGFSISSKTLLRFVSFTATIMLVITALRKFDIEL